MERKWTDAQRAAIEERECALLVSAAAGSGKTASLTERVIRTLKDPKHPGDLSRMLLVTFTNASAEDMRQKILGALEEALEEDPSNAHLQHQALLLPSAEIETIDAFCSRLLRHHTAEAGLPPDFRTADAAEASLLRASVMDLLLDEAAAGLVPEVGSEEEVLTLLRDLAPLKRESELRELLLGLYEKVSCEPTRTGVLTLHAERLSKEASLPFLRTRAGRYVSEKYRRILSFFLSEMEKEIPLLAEEEEKARLYFTDEREMLSSLSLLLSGDDDDALRALLMAPRGARPRKTKNASEAMEALILLHDEIKTQLLSPLLFEFFPAEEAVYRASARRAASFALVLSRLMVAFERRYKEASLEQRVADFSEMEFLTYRLLCREDGTPSALALSLRERYDYVYVDEFQDVNRLQHALISAVAKEGALFAVGDVKQSIYSFRRAEPGIFAALRQKASPIGEEAAKGALSLVLFSDNFRCDPPVIRYINRLFDRLFPLAGGDVSYDPAFDALRPSKVGQVGDFPVKTCFFGGTFAAEGGEDGPSSAVEAEARYVAEEVATLLSRGRKNDGTPYTPDDIVLLFRTRTNMEPFRRALSSVCPVRTDSGDFFHNPEVSLALALFHAIDNPRRDIYLAASLRSPVFGFTFEDLIRVRREGGEDVPLFDSLLRYLTLHPEFRLGARAVSMLRDWQQMAEGVPLDRLILTVYRESGLLTMSGEGTEPEHKNLLLFYHYARSFEASSYRGLSSFLSFLGRVIEDGRTLLSPVSSGDMSAVRLMTVHTSKGLEFPAVFLCDCGRALSPKELKEDFLYEYELGFTGRLQRSVNGQTVREPSPLRSAIALRLREKNAEEEMRILYVAMTRARERLFLSGRTRASVPSMERAAEAGRVLLHRDAALGASSWLDWLLPAAWGDEELTLRDLAPAPAEGEAEDTSAEAAARKESAEETATERTAAEKEKAEGARAQEANAEKAPADEAKARPSHEETGIPAEEYEALFRRRFSFVYPEEVTGRLPEKLSVSRLEPDLFGEGSLWLGEKEAPAGAEWLFPKRQSEGEGEKTPPAEGVAQNGHAGCGSAEGAAQNAGSAAAAGDEGEKPFIPSHPLFLSEKDPAEGAKRGTATHRFLQFCDLRLLKEHGSERELSRLIGEEFLSREDGALVRLDEIEFFRSSPLLSRLLAAKRLRRELRFHVTLPASLFALEDGRKNALGGVELLIQGVIDCLGEEEDGYFLADYKTDRLSAYEMAHPSAADQTLRQRYQSQLTYYREAALRMYGKPPKETFLYSLPLGRIVKM